MKKYLIIALFAGLVSTTVSAQESMFNIGYNIGVPMSDTESYIGDASTRGFDIGGRKFIYDFFSIGGQGGWQVFNSTKTGTFELDENKDATGKQFRYLNVFPLMFNTHYYLGEDGGIRPYLGTGVGVTWVNTRTEMGLFASDDTSTHFSVAPEFGFLIPIGVAGAGLNLSVRYNQAFKSSNDIHIQYFSFHMAFAFFN